MNLRSSLVGLSLVLSAGTVSALPVIPGAAGYGIDTPAGRGGTVHEVTNLNESGSGSLRECIEASGPRVCVFEVSGIIRLTRNLNVKNPFITIAGQTAPSPGIMLRGAGLFILTHDVLVQHMRVRPGDDLDGPAGTNRDAMAIANSASPPTNVVVDHCTFNWSVDEMISTWYEVGDVTLRQVIAAEALDDSIHVDEGVTDGTTDTHGFGPLFGPAHGRVSVQGSLLAHMRARQPLSYVSELTWVNNVLYDRVQRFTDLGNRDGITTQNSFVGNVFIEGSSTADYAMGALPIKLASDFASPSKLHAADNVWSEAPNASDQWELVSNDSGLSRSAVEAGMPSTWPSGMTAKPTAGDETLDWVLDKAGARPLDRDSVEDRIVNQVRSGTGSIINCVSADGSQRCMKNAGGWPSYAENTRAFTPVADPGGDADNDGYTNLEEQLHEMAAELEDDPGTAGSGGAGGSGGSAGSIAAGGSAGGGGSSGGAGGAAAGAANATEPVVNDADSGCALSRGSTPQPLALSLLAGLFLLGLRRRR